MSRHLEKMLGNIETRGGTQARINRMLGGPVPNSTQQNYHKGNGYDECKRVLAKQRMTENERILDELCKERPWLRGRKWPMFSLEGKGYEFTGVLSGGDVSAGTPPRVSSNPVFIEYATAYLKLDYIDGFERAEAQEWLYQAQAQEDLLQAKEAARAISNQNLQDTREEDSALRQEWKDKAVTRNVNFGSGFLPMLTAYRALEQKRYFRAFDLTLSKKQQDAISSRSDGTGYNLMMKQLPDLDGTDETKHAVLNAVLFNPSRWYGLQALIESGNASKSYTDDEGVVRSISTNKARPKGGFDSSKFED